MPDLQSIIEGAFGDDEQKRTLMQAFYDQLTMLNQSTGNNWNAPANQNQKPSSQPPMPGTLTVDGANGTYVVIVTNAAQGGLSATIYNQVAYSPIQSFGQNVTTLPTGVGTHYTVPRPGSQLFFRARFSFDRNTWSSWVTGTVAVESKLQSSAATSNNVILNQSNYGFIDSVTAGATADIRIYGASGPYHGFTSVKGEAEVPQPSATIINVPHGSTQVVAYDGEQYQLKSTLPGAFPDTWTPTGTVSVVGTGSPTLPTITPVISAGHLVGASFTPGSGLTQAPTLAVTDSGGGTGGAAVATVSGGVMTGIQITNAGSGYSGATVIAASGGVFGGATGGGQSAGGNNGRLVF